MKKLLVMVLFMMPIDSIYSQVKATTEDGRTVVLNDDGTYSWETSISDETLLIDNDIFIYKVVDEFTDEYFYTLSKKLVLIDEENDQGFNMNFGINKDKIIAYGINAVIVGLDCLEDVEVNYLFEDESKLAIKSWNKFNCDGDAWFNLSLEEVDMLGSKSLSKIRVRNGRNYESMTFTLEGADKQYFKQAYNSIVNKDIRLYVEE
jgi:hypothetical protein